MGVLIPAAAFSGCALGRVGLGAAKGGYVVDAAARDEAAARRAAVAQFYEAFVSSSARAAAGDAFERSLPAAATSYVTSSRVLGASGEGGERRLKARCLVDYARLGRDLESAGWVKPAGVVGRIKAAISIAEPSPGLASEALRRALADRGYAAYVLERPEGEQAALSRAKAQGAALLLAGSARSRAATQAALSDFHPSDAELELKVYGVAKGEVIEDLTADATAVDLDAEGAAAKALSNAGLLAADKLRRFLAGRFVERTEISVLVLGLGGLPETLRLLAALRGEPGVAGAAVAALGGGDVKLRVFAERLSADELAADMLKLPGWSFSVRSVEPDFNSVELDTAGEVPL